MKDDSIVLGDGNGRSSPDSNETIAGGLEGLCAFGVEEGAEGFEGCSCLSLQDSWVLLVSIKIVSLVLGEVLGESRVLEAVEGGKVDEQGRTEKAKKLKRQRLMTLWGRQGRR